MMSMTSMMRSMIAAVATLVMLTSAPLLLAADEKVDLKKAWTDGKLELTFTGKDNGETLELTMKNVSSAVLVVSVPSGTTTFNLSPEEIRIVTSAAENIRLAPELSANRAFKQTGTDRIKTGSVTLRYDPKK